MFWEKEDNYNIIEDISKEELKKYLDEHNVSIDLDNFAGSWAGFSNYYGREHGLTDIESASFGAIISSFMAGMGVSAGTELYLNEEAIETKALNIYNNIVNNVSDVEEVDKKKLFFETVFNIYKLDISNFELKTNRLEVRLTEKEYRKFMDIPGENKTEKFRFLLNKFEI